MASLFFLLKDYLTNCKERNKVEPSYSHWFEFIRGIPKGCILGPLLFNIFVNEIFFQIQKSNICNFADDNTLYYCRQDLQAVNENLTYPENPKKLQFMILSKTRRPKYNLLIIQMLKESANMELEKLIIDQTLSFENIIAKLYQTASYKLYALSRISKHLTFEKARVLENAFVDSQFNYVPLDILRESYLFKMQKTQHKALRAIYQSTESYENLLNLDNSVSLHQRHIRFLLAEIWIYFSNHLVTLAGY